MANETTEERGDQAERLAAVIEADLQALEAAAGQSSPGLLDVLRVYGQFEEAQRQTDYYLSLLNPQPTFSASDSSAGVI